MENISLNDGRLVTVGSGKDALDIIREDFSAGLASFLEAWTEELRFETEQSAWKEAENTFNSETSDLISRLEKKNQLQQEELVKMQKKLDRYHKLLKKSISETARRNLSCNTELDELPF